MACRALADAMHGFININKPAGLTSHDVVARVRRIAGRGIKVGHAGTLDPAATGVLPVALGHATRLIEYLVDTRKGYVGLVRLGETTSTDDGEGEILATRPVPPLDIVLVEAAVAPLRGAILQVPPIYSALHHNGQRLYDLARAGKHVELAPRPVTIFELHWTIRDPASISIEVECAKGTYIRALARDIGAHLGCGGHLAALERTMVGPFRLGQAVALDTLMAQPALLAEQLLPLEIALADWPMLALDAEQTRLVRNGMPLRLEEQPDERARAHDAAGNLVALLRRVDGVWKPEKVFA